MFESLKATDPKIYKLILDEIRRENENLELIASENFTSPAVLLAQGSVLTNKYAEGYPKRRWYGGCKFIDKAEEIAVERAKKLFRAEHINVQPHSGTQANMAVMFSVLKPKDKILAMDLSCGGHLSHGHPLNFSGKFFKVFTYGVDKNTETLDYDEILSIAKRCRPKLIICGASAYPRIIDFKKFREICDKVGSYLLADIAHIAGLIAAKLHPSPVDYAEFVTTTTHKTLRGPRAGMILCKKEFAEKIDREVFPGIQGGPLMHIIAAKAVAFKEAMTKKFKRYQKNVIKNAKRLAENLEKKGYRIVSGGTDTHLLLVDLSKQNLTGREAEIILEKAGIVVNRNLIPYDKRPPLITSGIRLGTPGVTTRGMGETEMGFISNLIDRALKTKKIVEVKEKVRDLTKKFPLYTDFERWQE